MLQKQKQCRQILNRWIAFFSISWILLGSIAFSSSSASASTPSGAFFRVGTEDLWQESAYGSAYGYSYAASPDPYYLYATRTGDLGLAEYREYERDLRVVTYSSSSLRQIGKPVTVPLAGWPLWGGLLAAPDGTFFVLVGRHNEKQQDSLNVVAVRHYDASWSLLGTAYVKGGASQGFKGIYQPFRSGAPDMELVGNRLVVHMSRLMYKSERDGLRHQGNFTFEVDTQSMQAKSFNDLGRYPYASHSFQQLITTYGNSLFLVDHGDAYPRSIQLSVFPSYPKKNTLAEVDLFEFDGEIGENYTGAGVTDLLSGPHGIVVLGHSVRHSGLMKKTLNWDESRNVVSIAWTPDEDVYLDWLTTFPPTGPVEAGEPRSVLVGPDRYAVLFNVSHRNKHRLEYRLIDSSGEVHSSASFPGIRFPTVSQPVLIGNSIYWVGVSPKYDLGSPAYLFGIDVTNAANPVIDRRATRKFTAVPIPTISGKLKVGKTLRADPRQWIPSPDSFRFKWYAGGSRVTRTSSRKLRIPRRLAGKRLRVKVEGRKTGYATDAIWSSTTRRVRP